MPASAKYPYLWALAMCLLVGMPLLGGSQPPSPTVLGGTIPGTDAVVTVAEGPREPRSAGSYALRLYLPTIRPGPTIRLHLAWFDTGMALSKRSCSATLMAMMRTKWSW